MALWRQLGETRRLAWAVGLLSDVVRIRDLGSARTLLQETIDLFRQAMSIWLEELPEVPLVQWFHRIPQNTTYWDNWPTQDNPYNSALWHLTMPITLWFLKAKG